jgi:hypothetical protein
MAKVKKKLLWLQVCEPCSKSPTGKHEFYVPVSSIGKWRAKWNQWLGKLDDESMSGYRKVCRVCKSIENVRIKTIRERKIKEF